MVKNTLMFGEAMSEERKKKLRALGEEQALDEVQPATPTDKQRRDQRRTWVSRGMLEKYRDFLTARQIKFRAGRKKRTRVKQNFISDILYSDPGDYRYLKAVLCLPFGMAIAYALLFFVLHRLNFPEDIQVLFSMAFIVLFGLAFGLFVAVRCLTVLCLPHLFTLTGQCCVNVLMLALLVQGPVTGIISSSKEVGRSIVCSGALMLNQTQESLKLKMLPILDVLINIVGGNDEVRDNADELMRSIDPMLDEIESETSLAKQKRLAKMKQEEIRSASLDKLIKHKQTRASRNTNSEEIVQKYQFSMLKTCKKMTSDSVKACKDYFAVMHTKCMDKLPYIIDSIICLVFKLSFVCNVLNSVLGWLGFSCEDWSFIDSSLSTAIETAQNVIGDIDEQFDAQLQFMTSDDDFSNQWFVWAISDIKAILKGEFDWRQRGYQFGLACIDRFVVLLFLFIVYSSHKYQIQFLTNLQFDNIYITKHFRHIDIKRRFLKKRALLPLKKMEEKRLVVLTRGSMNLVEGKKALSSLLGLISKFGLCASVTALDYLFYEVLRIVTKHGKIEFQQTGVHRLQSTVDGTGILAKITRCVLSYFNFDRRLNNITTNEDCLPRPIRTTHVKLVFLYLAVFGSYIIAILETYAKRSCRSITAYFYRKREKKRIIQLYNDTLRKRVGFLKYARHRVRRMIRQKLFTMPVSFLRALRKICPYLCFWLYKIFGLGKTQCLICEENETDEFVYCVTRGCSGVYCEDCWEDIKMKCYACRPRDEWSVSSILSGEGDPEK